MIFFMYQPPKTVLEKNSKDFIDRLVVEYVFYVTQCVQFYKM